MGRYNFIVVEKFPRGVELPCCTFPMPVEISTVYSGKPISDAEILEKGGNDKESLYSFYGLRRVQKRVIIEQTIVDFKRKRTRDTFIGRIDINLEALEGLVTLARSPSH